MQRIECTQPKDRYLQLVSPKQYTDDSCTISDHTINVKNIKLKKFIEEPDRIDKEDKEKTS